MNSRRSGDWAVAKPASDLTAADFPVSEADMAHIGETLIRYFVHNQPRVSHPSVVFIGGQPGSGKSMLVEHYRRALGGAVVVDSDVVRQLHPAILDIAEAAPLRFDVLTNGPVGDWCNRIIESARHRRCNVIIENTFANPATVLGEAQRFAEAGYMVGFLCLAVPSSVSRLGIVNRFRQAARVGGSMPRWTTETSHSAALTGLNASVQQFVGAQLGGVVVTDRNLAHRHRITQACDVADTLQEVRDAFFAELQSVQQWQESYGACVTFLLDRGLVTNYTARLLYNLAWDAEALRPLGLHLPGCHTEFRHRVSQALRES
ncbi:zeta toxin family protein [Corynebacterium sp.]|uniref:zeta toxin family protein n=1 Tax=Corynebacterium sp. TaxID=1720 RepID=UPI0026DD7235|nr:zeta toxin family protein [Corynebacterium sp.]MDO5076367.1 zeta toxin family protein [Corynebacterium sp.]